MHQNVGMATDFSDWITKRTQKSARALTSAINKDATAITRADTSGTVPANTVIAVCLANDVPVLLGLHAAGYLSAEQVENAAAHASPSLATDSELLSHLLHRALDRERDDTETTPTGNIVNLDDRRTPPAGTSGVTSAALDAINDDDIVKHLNETGEKYAAGDDDSINELHRDDR